MSQDKITHETARPERLYTIAEAAENLNLRDSACSR